MGARLRCPAYRHAGRCGNIVRRLPFTVRCVATLLGNETTRLPGASRRAFGRRPEAEQQSTDAICPSIPEVYLYAVDEAAPFPRGGASSSTMSRFSRWCVGGDQRCATSWHCRETKTESYVTYHRCSRSHVQKAEPATRMPANKLVGSNKDRASRRHAQRIAAKHARWGVEIAGRKGCKKTLTVMSASGTLR